MSVLHVQDKPLVLTQLSYIELMFGLDREKKKHRDEERVIDSLFKDFSVLPISAQAAKTASQLYHASKKKGTMIGQCDCLLAGTLISKGISSIITNNKHFSLFKDLRIISYEFY